MKFLMIYYESFSATKTTMKNNEHWNIFLEVKTEFWYNDSVVT